MAVTDIALGVIDDNPYNPRKHYPQTKVKEMGQSLQEVGLLQVPEGRPADGKVQLAYGHMRLRGFGYNLKHDPYPENEKWKTMPVNVKEISDQDMFHFSMEENLRRSDITPIEVARCIAAFSEIFPDVLDEEIGQKHSMSPQNVSNMKRVLRLPEKFLEKIDQEVISFTQGRELLTMEGLDNAENLMSSALGGLRTGNKGYGHANTVDGLQVSMHEIISRHYRPLDKDWGSYRWDLLFDTREAGCLKCDKMIKTHPTKSQVAHYCTDEECWLLHENEHREKASAAAKAKMEAEVLERAAKEIAQRTPEPDKTTICVDQETFAKLEASNSCDRISEGTAVRKPVKFEDALYVATRSGMGKVEAYHLVPRIEFIGEVRTYRVPKGRESGEYYDTLRNDPNGFYHEMLVKRGKEDCVLVGPEVTFVTLVDKGDLSQEKSVEARADERGQQMEEAQERANLERPVGEAPCDTCLTGETCNRTFFHVADDNSGRLICEQWEDQQSEQDVSRRITQAPAPTPQEIPEDILALAREKAGSRAEILDLNEISTGGTYYRQVKPGYAEIDVELRYIDDPTFCIEHCTQGFHYAFDSKAKTERVISVCSNTKCLAKKKGAHTRKENAAGQARKNAETKAIKEAIAQVSTVGRGEMKLILLTQIKGKHLANYYHEVGVKKPEKWLWDKVSAGTADLERNTESLFKKIDKLGDGELAKLVVGMMFYYLVDHDDIGRHEIKTELPLSWLGVTIEIGATDE